MSGEGGIVRPRRFAFFLTPDFSLMSFSSAIEPLRAANRLSGQELYQWQITAKEKGVLHASNALPFMIEHDLGDLGEIDDIVVCGALDCERYDDPQVFAWLRRMGRQGKRLGAVSTGSYLLAKAGLLDGYRCTLHWEYLEGFMEAYPDIEVTSEVFEIDRNRFTSAGGTAALDMMLSIIAEEHDREVATAVAENFIHDRIRDQHDQQRMALRTRLGISHPKLLKVISLMEENLEEPLPRSDLARQAGLSTRQLERLFRKYLSRTPTRFYLELRLTRARHLLSQTSLSVLDVALACGFVSASHFSKCYREYFDRTPREERLQVA